MSDPTAVVQKIGDFVWGPFLLIPLLLLTGLYLTIRLRGIQFRKLWHSLYVALIVRREKGAEGDISHFQALMTALAATVGTGNIVGVATAIATGGPGALFWMWMTGLVGMATKFSEALLSVKFRVTDERGEQCGGPMYYLANGIRWRGLGKTLGWLFALFAVFASFGIGNMVQSNSVAAAIKSSFGVTPAITGIIIAIATGAVIIGGIKSIAKVTSKIVPIMAIFYVLGSLIVLFAKASMIPEAFSMIFSNAFSGTAVGGGLIGTVIRFGVARGVFSNEAGLGSAPIAHAASKIKDPVIQGIIASLGSFLDTLVVCTMTALVILVSGLITFDGNGLMMITDKLSGAALTSTAFNQALPGLGPVVVTVGLIFFAFSTILGWYYYGSKCFEYIAGVRAVEIYKWVYVVLVFVGATVSLNFVWNLSDTFNGLMAIPNLIALLALCPLIFSMLRDYEAGKENSVE